MGKYTTSGSISGEKGKFLYVSWEDIYNACLKIFSEIERKNVKIDCIVAISRGGMIPAAILANCLDVRKVIVVNVKLYKEIGVKGKLEIERSLDLEKADISTVLIVDDIVDTGETLEKVREYIADYVWKVYTAAIFVKEWSKVKPDYYVYRTTRWVIFPWEIFEVVHKEGVEMDALMKIGVPKEILKKVSEIVSRGEN